MSEAIKNSALEYVNVLMSQLPDMLTAAGADVAAVVTIVDTAMGVVKGALLGGRFPSPQDFTDLQTSIDAYYEGLAVEPPPLTRSLLPPNW